MTNIVTIVGSPNVGKSTLFNRLIGDMQAIVDDMPGVTRDRQYGMAEWCGHTFVLVDTGGYTERDGDNIAQKINQQVAIAVEEATLILFVVDCKIGITAQDLALAKLLRKNNKPVLVVANKADNATLRLEKEDFYSLGLGEVYAITASHGTGSGDLLDGMMVHFKVTPEKEEKKLPKIAFIGRPNVGKSTFINALIGKERNIVDNRPHTTRTATNSYYQLYNKRLILVDTAGIAKKKQTYVHSIEFYALIRSIKALEEADVCAVIIDAQDGLTTQDKNILTLAHRKHKGIVLLVNKWDAVNKSSKEASQYRKKLQDQLGYMNYVPILCTSGMYKKHIYQAIELVLEVYENKFKRISTAMFNKIVQKAIYSNPPPSPKGRDIKINYATQVKASFPVFSFFCNYADDIPMNYKRYLEKHIRLFADFKGVPMTLLFKKKSIQKH